jgi:hypothetical protein
MSGIDFERVTDRFFVDLEESDTAGVSRDEARIALVVRGMSYLKLKVTIFLESVGRNAYGYVVLSGKPP